MKDAPLPEGGSLLWTEGVISRRDGQIVTRKYSAEELVRQASDPDFQEAIIHTTIVGLEENELWR